MIIQLNALAIGVWMSEPIIKPTVYNKKNTSEDDGIWLGRRLGPVFCRLFLTHDLETSFRSDFQKGIRVISS